MHHVYTHNMSPRRVLVWLLAACALAAPVRAQVLRDPAPATATPSAPPGSATAAGRRLQQEFENFRRAHLPHVGAIRPKNCDETVGRFCYWYNENEVMPPEPKIITDARERFVATLDSLARVEPADRWITGQRVRYLDEAGRHPAALDAARECKVGGWWCDILIGFALHELGEYVQAERVYEGAIAKMLARDQCAWHDVSLLIDDDARQQYRRYECGDPQRRAFEERVWFLGRTLYAMPGNDTRTEWYARQTMAQFLTDAPSQYQFDFDADERELMLRFGWDHKWALSREGINGEETLPAYRMIPAGFVINEPSLSDSANWRLQLPPVFARYGPPYATVLKPLEHQKAVFHRGDSALVVLAYDSRTMPELAGAPISASLAVTPGTAPVGYVKTVRNAPPVGMLMVKAPWGPLLMSAEVAAPERHAVARARYGVRPPYAVGTRVTVSDLLFYKPYGTFPSTVEDAAPHAVPTERLRADEKLGVYWESYGTDPAGERMSVSLTVVKEVEEAGFLRRKAEALKLVRQATPVSVSVDDMSARGAGISPRAIELDISTLKKGSYIVQLEITVAGQYTVRADHRIEIIAP
jgi:hypothetical protein